MQFVPGPSLKERMEQGPMPPEEVRPLLRRLAAGLLAAHENKYKVYHRDLSPDNVILEDGRVERAKLIDFGIAKGGGASDGGKSIIGDKIAGKYGYMAPEQLGLFSGTVDARTDIYSLGLIMLGLFRGQAVDMGKNIGEAVLRRQKIPDLAAVTTAAPELEGLLARMLEPDPELRPASMAEVITLLDQAQPQRLRPTSEITVLDPRPGPESGPESDAAGSAAQPATQPPQTQPPKTVPPQTLPPQTVPPQTVPPVTAPPITQPPFAPPPAAASTPGALPGEDRTIVARPPMPSAVSGAAPGAVSGAAPLSDRTVVAPRAPGSPAERTPPPLAPETPSILPRPLPGPPSGPVPGTTGGPDLGSETVVQPARPSALPGSDLPNSGLPNSGLPDSAQPASAGAATVVEARPAMEDGLDNTGLGSTDLDELFAPAAAPGTPAGTPSGTASGMVAGLGSAARPAAAPAAAGKGEGKGKAGLLLAGVAVLALAAGAAWFALKPAPEPVPEPAPQLAASPTAPTPEPAAPEAPGAEPQVLAPETPKIEAPKAPDPIAPEAEPAPAQPSGAEVTRLVQAAIAAGQAGRAGRCAALSLMPASDGIVLRATGPDRGALQAALDAVAAGLPQGATLRQEIAPLAPATAATLCPAVELANLRGALPAALAVEGLAGGKLASGQRLSGRIDDPAPGKRLYLIGGETGRVTPLALDAEGRFAVTLDLGDGPPVQEMLLAVTTPAALDLGAEVVDGHGVEGVVRLLAHGLQAAGQEAGIALLPFTLD